MTTTATAGTDAGVRDATLADLLAIFRIEKASFAQPWPYAAFERYLDAAGFLVAETDGVVGYVVADTVATAGGTLGHVKDFAVAPASRRQGIGGMLLGAAIRALAREGVVSIKLEVREGNDSARSLYRTFDFRHARTVPGYYADGENALLMIRNVESR